MKGKVVKIINNFYYVETSADEVLDCKLKGTHLKDEQYPYVGDQVEVEYLSGEFSGVITDIYPRTNILNRPKVANVDQVVVVTSTTDPKPNLQLLDRLLVMSFFAGILSVVCINKSDLDIDKAQEIMELYSNMGYPVVMTSTAEGSDNVTELLELLSGKVSVFAGQSGVGKSSLANVIKPGLELQTNPISKKGGGGKHTTRYCQLIKIGENSYLADTPGFHRQNLPSVKPENLVLAFPDIKTYAANCKFNDCSHTHEPACDVRPRVGKEINETRYKHFITFFEELVKQERSF